VVEDEKLVEGGLGTWLMVNHFFGKYPYEPSMRHPETQDVLLLYLDDHHMPQEQAL